MPGFSVNFALVLCLMFANLAYGQLPPASASGPHIDVHLLSEMNALVPGKTQYLAIQMQPEHHWHTYWQNPGDSGEPPKIDWSDSSSTLTFGSIIWPFPEPISVAHLVNYGYSDDHLLMVPVHVPSELQPGQTIDIQADVSWLVCQEDCTPGWASLSIRLPVENRSTANAKHQTLFSDTRKRLPDTDVQSAQFEVIDAHIALALPPLNSGKWHVFPVGNEIASHSAPQQFVTDKEQTQVLLTKSDYFAGSPETLSFLVSDGTTGFYVAATPVSDNVAQGSLSIFDIALYAGMALLGGLILNIMPCVLPILSIKALSLQHIASNAKQNWAYLAGVFFCFNLFAFIIIGLQLGGTELGWGFHLQSPWVIGLLAFLFTFIALALLDVFQFGSGLANIGDSLVTGNSSKSHFFTGALAVIVASPCTAPFMAVALGIALVQPPFISLIIFNALALGFALPLTLLFVYQPARRFLPKPGAWMSVFKQGLAFPMFATVAWLCWVYAGQTSSLSQFLLVTALIVFSFFAWLYGKAARRVSLARAALIGMLVPLLVVIANPNDKSIQANNEAKSEHMAYSASTLQTLKSENQVVLVNMTADWCITCKVNEHVALSSDIVKRKLNDPNIHYMVGDWTNKNDAILTYLKQFDRAGVPLYVVYAGEEYVTVLPQVLTPDLVVTSLNQALQER